MTTQSHPKRPNPILLAATHQQPSIVSAILAHRLAPKINLDELDSNGASAMCHLLHRVSSTDETKAAVEDLIANGAKIDSVETDLSAHERWDPETRRHEQPKIHLAQLALKNWNAPWKPVFDALGPKKLKAISDAWPILHEALHQGKKDAAEMILSAGADPNKEFAHYGLPITCCSSPAAFSMLVAAGAKLTLADSKGKTALQEISASRSGQNILSMATAAAQAETEGLTAVFKEGQAVKKTKASDLIAQPLIEALFESIDRKNNERIKSLWNTLNLGRDKTRTIDARDSKNRTLLHAAIAHRNFALSKRLIARGASVDVFDDSDQTPFSIFYTLKHERSERDRHGDNRRKFAMEILSKVDWNAKNPNGIGYFELLYSLSPERNNGFSTHSIFSKANATASDWLDMSTDGKTFRLSRCVARSVIDRYPPNSSISDHQSSIKHMAQLITEQIDRPEFTREHAIILLNCTASKKVERSLDYPSEDVKKILGSIEAHLPRFIALGVDPETIEWAPCLATRFPAIAAAVESWQLSATALIAATPKAKSRSL